MINKKLFILFLSMLVILSSCQLCRTIFYNFANITDYKIFENRDLHANNKPFVFPVGKAGGAIVPEKVKFNGKMVSFEKYLKENNTVAFLIIHNDTIVYENYFNGYNQTSIVSSFSMAKSYTSALIGCAIEDGLIQSVEQSVTDFIPELQKNGFEKVTIKHLLQMTSGLDFKESYADPFGEAATFYYGKNIEKNCLHLTLKRESGRAFDYTSGSTQLLGLILKRALKDETITHYFDRKIWFPLEMEYDGSWSIDDEGGMEKTFCCINARARDYAKFGRLYLNHGNWNGKQIISSKWVNESLTADTKEGGADFYKYQWWLMQNNNDKAFYAEGILGQFIYVDPVKNLIIVRLGKDAGKVYWQGLFANYAMTVQ